MLCFFLIEYSPPSASLPKAKPRGDHLTARLCCALLSTFCCALPLTTIVKKLVMSNNARIVFDFIKKGLHGCYNEYGLTFVQIRRKRLHYFFLSTSLTKLRIFRSCDGLGILIPSFLNASSMVSIISLFVWIQVE